MNYRNSVSLQRVTVRTAPKSTKFLLCGQENTDVIT
nr:MAG TPA: hypothetical protein [Caudoviricetes sp.]